ncbi:MAG: bifunctional demethylmenaquinone methyltransferase/2-methoxy-6-polyprenyl-1,4-benzoquinol methylase UbiE [Verrucomicrobiota bacterium]
MTNKFYAPGEERARKVRDLFTLIAPRYDLINDLQSLSLHRAWKRRVVRLARVGPETKVLDLCCGTGDLAFALSETGATVAGLDFNAAMLSVAQGRAAKFPGGFRGQFVQGDALQLPFATDTFDAITVGYGLRNLSNLEAGLKEMRRVLKPRGRLVVLDFGKPDSALWRTAYFAYLRRAVPLFGKLFCGDRDTHGYILESLDRYPGQHGVAEVMRGLQFERVETIDLLGGAMGINVAEK